MKHTQHFFEPLLQGALVAADSLAKSIPAFHQSHPDLLSGFGVDILHKEAQGLLQAFMAAEQLSDTEEVVQSLADAFIYATRLIQILNELNMRSPATLSCSVMVAQVKALCDIADILGRTIRNVSVHEDDIKGETFHHLGVMLTDKEDDDA